MNELTPKRQVLPPSEEERRKMAQVWAVGLAAFGNTWTQNYGHAGDPAFRLWVNECRRLMRSKHFFGAAKQVLTFWGRRYPPNLAEFRGSVSLEIRTRIAQEESRQLTQLRLRKDGKKGGGLTRVAQEEIQKIRTMLRKGGNDD